MMEIKVMFPADKPTADIMTLNCAVAMKSTRTQEPAHDLVETNWRLQCQYKPEPDFCKKCDSTNFCLPKLIGEAKRMKHWGVFEHFFATVSVSEISRALTHQLVRHRLFSYMQQSQRHVNPSKRKDWYVFPHSWDNTGKVVSVEVSSAIAESDSLIRRSADVYAKLISVGIPEEDARYVLPNACHTHIVVSGNARNWLHFFRLRLAPSAQWEIREMAQKILAEFMKIAPIIFEGAGELEV